MLRWHVLNVVSIAPALRSPEPGPSGHDNADGTVRCRHWPSGWCSPGVRGVPTRNSHEMKPSCARVDRTGITWTQTAFGSKKCRLNPHHPRRRSHAESVVNCWPIWASMAQAALTDADFWPACKALAHLLEKIRTGYCNQSEDWPDAR